MSKHTPGLWRLFAKPKEFRPLTPEEFLERRMFEIEYMKHQWRSGNGVKWPWETPQAAKGGGDNGK